MKLIGYFIIFFSLSLVYGQSNSSPIDSLPTEKKAKVSFDDYKNLLLEVENHRKARLINFETFWEMAQDENTIILDTRSKEMYDAKHIKGAVHLNFSNFSQNNLANIIPSKDTRILIYCNNNFEDDQVYFFTKSVIPETSNEKEITLALNIPTYINLYGYGYKNVYELHEMISAISFQYFDGTVFTNKNQ